MTDVPERHGPWFIMARHGSYAVINSMGFPHRGPFYVATLGKRGRVTRHHEFGSLRAASRVARVLSEEEGY